jgi:glycosyltransferase involved in cell wall biosynthesis
MPRLEFVIPVFNEQESLPSFHPLLAGVPLPPGFVPNYIYVNDGSEDQTQEILEEIAATDNRVTILELSRNFGHQAALSAGLESATGDVVITLDGDGQHPASLVPEMLRLYAGGCDIVQATRMDEAGKTSFFKRITSRLFYLILNVVGEVKLFPGASDFRLLSRRALDALLQLPEHHRFYRGMTTWIGFTSAELPYKPNIRIGGQPKYSLKKMLQLASDGFFSFSLGPLRLALILGIIFIGLAALEVVYVAWLYLGGQHDQLVRGWTSLILMLTVSSAINMILVGILGIYVGMIFREVKGRPVYLIKARSKAKGA